MKRIELVQSEVLRYFAAEQAESLLFILVGISALIVSAFLFRMPGLYRGITYSLVSIALIQLIVGATVYLRTNNQVTTLTQQLNIEPVAFQTSELNRMQTVMAGFKWYKIIEVLLLSSGILLIFTRPRQSALFGAGIGLIIQSALTLILDIFAERRGKQYLQAIGSFLDS